MSATIQNLTIEQGVDFGVNISVVDLNGSPVNLNGATVVAQIRSIGTHSLLASFTSTLHNNVIYLSLSGSASLAAPSGAAKWDVLLKIGELSYRVIQGDCFISQAQSIPA